MVGPICITLKYLCMDDVECGDLGCNQRCERGKDGLYQCACHPGHRLQEDNKTCVENGQP